MRLFKFKTSEAYYLTYQSHINLNSTHLYSVCEKTKRKQANLLSQFISGQSGLPGILPILQIATPDLCITRTVLLQDR